MAVTLFYPGEVFANAKRGFNSMPGFSTRTARHWFGRVVETFGRSALVLHALGGMPRIFGEPGAMTDAVARRFMS